MKPYIINRNNLYSENLSKILYEMGLIIIKSNIPFSIEELKEIGSKFGNLYKEPDNSENFYESNDKNNYTNLFADKEKYVTRITNELDENNQPMGALGKSSILWHSDFSHMAGNYHGTLLYNVKGGHLATTTWLSTKTLYELIKDKISLTNVIGYHSIANKYPINKNDKFVLGRVNSIAKHPLIVINPAGYKCLYISPGTLIKTEPEIDLKEILELINNKELYYTHNWNNYDLVIMENLSTIHKRSKVKEGIRLLYRLHFEYNK